MDVPNWPDAIQQIMRTLAEATNALVTSDVWSLTKLNARNDAILKAGNRRFVVEWKTAATSAAISQAVQQARRVAEAIGREAVPIVAVPFMGDAGRTICAQSKMNWLDLCGNASIRAPGIVYVGEGRRNKYAKRGRPSSPFAPKSARIARWFLTNKHADIRQKDLASATGLGEGFVSRIISRLIDSELVIKTSDSKLRVTSRGRMLDAWREDYNFLANVIIRGYVAARSGELLLHEIRQAASDANVGLAFTGLAGAWLYDQFASFNIVTAYLKAPFEDKWLAPLSFRADERGANLWLVRPRDEGVFAGATEIEGSPVVHPVQVYLDLKGHPERAAEAADELRKRHLMLDPHD